MKILESIWSQSASKNMVCPQCHAPLAMVQIEPITDKDSPYTPYKTVIECSQCNFRIITESYTILGGVKSFDAHHIEIGSWSPSGSRVLTKYEHIIEYNLLKELQNTEELVEFLIVNKQVVQVIG